MKPVAPLFDPQPSRFLIGFSTDPAMEHLWSGWRLRPSQSFRKHRPGDLVFDGRSYIDRFIDFLSLGEKLERRAYF